MKKFLGGFFLAAGISVIAAASENPGISVHIHESRTSGQLICDYEVSNQSHMPIVIFGVGSNDGGQGPYELAVAPVRASAAASPPNWTQNILTDPSSKNVAIDWEAGQYDYAIMPGKIMSGFKAIFTEPAPHCDGIHWKAVTRDSEVISGPL